MLSGSQLCNELIVAIFYACILFLPIQMVVVWDTSRCGKSGEVSVIAKAHTDVDITRIKIAPFDDTRLETSWKNISGRLVICNG